MVTPHAAGFRRARAEITGWEGYASTRLLDLPPPGTIRLKDESGLETFMAGLACGEPGLLAWRELECSATAFMGIPDAAAIDTMRFLADQGIVAGESGAVGLAGARLAMADKEASAALGLDADSRILTFSTEGATDVAVYAALIGS